MHITIDSDTMQVDNTKVIVDKIEDPFKDYGPTIVHNIVSYSSSLEEEVEIKVDSPNKDEGISVEKIVEEAKVTTPTSIPVPPITPIFTTRPSTQSAQIVQVPSDDE